MSLNKNFILAQFKKYANKFKIYKTIGIIIKFDFRIRDCYVKKNIEKNDFANRSNDRLERYIQRFEHTHTCFYQ
ncbi:hypothetical protein CAMRE0001_1224 [Campylobacter rectus RM3267]|uniref:Uncharacterized protein n=1 Tax=Campylobacter rectus RM3267 TaxID=553218 RepID=B9D0L7_CAMRE|nr:hypothetical protein CAMRE0001_1224 [Campylobacter rectus RM3267]